MCQRSVSWDGNVRNARDDASTVSSKVRFSEGRENVARDRKQRARK